MKDLTGMKFGRWTVEGFVGRTNAYLWRCRCECGTTRNVRSGHLNNGASVSCGCLNREVNRDRAIKVNGQRIRQTKIYRCWLHIIDRCHNPKNPDFRWYGARGIEVCREWRGSSPAFYEWAIANGHADGLEIDRIDNNGPYSPENCRWVTHLENLRNTSRTTPYK